MHRTIYSVHSKFLKTGIALDKPQSRKPATTTTNENTELPEQAFAKNQKKSIQRNALEFSINKSSIQQMLQRLIKPYPHRLQVAQSLHADHDAGVKMCKSLLHHYQHYSQILENLWFSHESIFYLSGHRSIDTIVRFQVNQTQKHFVSMNETLQSWWFGVLCQALL